MGLEVYVVLRSVDYEGEDIVGIYHSELKANEYAKLRNSETNLPSDVSFYVEEWAVEDA